MILSLIGMSNIGKSFWSKQLEKKGFVRFDGDALIEKRWSGEVFREHDADSEEQYLRLESQVMTEIMDEVLRLPEGSSAVIDCTGSVIYLSATVLDKLQSMSTIVLFEAPQEVLKEMIERYYQFPKPLIWGTQTDYAALLDSRSKQYAELADVVIPYHTHRNPSWTTDDFLYALLQHQQQNASREQS